MKHNFVPGLLALTLSCVAGTVPVSAQESQPLLDKSEFAIGIGLARNSVDRRNDDGHESGFQLFAAYELSQVNLMEGVTSAVEFGLMDYGTRRDNTGIWASYTIDGTISDRFGWLARVGIDIGDDSGLMAGAGLGYAANENAELRLEYVARDEIDSLQFNFLYHL